MTDEQSQRCTALLDREQKGATCSRAAMLGGAHSDPTGVMQAG